MREYFQETHIYCNPHAVVPSCSKAIKRQPADTGGTFLTPASVHERKAHGRSIWFGRYSRLLRLPSALQRKSEGDNRCIHSLECQCR